MGTNGRAEGNFPSGKDRQNLFSIQCKQKWGPWTSCSSNNGPGVQIRFDLNDHTIQDVQACDGRVPTGKSEAIYGPCSKTCGGGKKAKYQLGKV